LIEWVRSRIGSDVDPSPADILLAQVEERASLVKRLSLCDRGNAEQAKIITLYEERIKDKDTIIALQQQTIEREKSFAGQQDELCKKQIEEAKPKFSDNVKIFSWGAGTATVFWLLVALIAAL
jgi:hypothetical protein